MGVFLFDIPNAGIGAGAAGGFRIVRGVRPLVQRPGRP